MLGGFNRYKPLLSALKKAGFKVVELVEQKKKTVITVSPFKTRRGIKSESYTLP
jgi:hypothetical protein